METPPFSPINAPINTHINEKIIDKPSSSQTLPYATPAESLPNLGPPLQFPTSSQISREQESLDNILSKLSRLEHSMDKPSIASESGGNLSIDLSSMISPKFLNLPILNDAIQDGPLWRI